MRQSDIDELPRLKALTEGRGLTFENSFVTTSLCCPSRATLLTGQYPHNHGVLSNDASLGRALAPKYADNRAYPAFARYGHTDDHIGTWMRRAGYKTGYYGKYLNQTPAGKPQPGWSDYYVLAAGGSYWTNTSGQVTVYENRLPDAPIVTRKITSLIESSDEPFFGVAAYKAPHNSALAPAQDRGTFARRPVPKPPSYNERDMSDKPSALRQLNPMNKIKKRKTQKEYTTRLDKLLAVERGVEEIYRALRETGKLGNTYVIFTSDNGYQLGEHRLHYSKTTHYEESMRVPLTVSGPGIAPGTSVKHMALNNDLAPTIAGIGGAAMSTERPPDGTALTKVLRPATRPHLSDWRRRFLNANWMHAWYMDWPATKAVRTRTRLYARTLGGERELYNLSKDPYELKSRHKSMKRSQKRRYNRHISALVGCDGAVECRRAEGF